MRTVTTPDADLRRDPTPATEPAARNLRDDRGSQAMEYALMGGVGAAACGGLGWLFQSEIFQQFLASLVDTLGSWFQGLLG